MSSSPLLHIHMCVAMCVITGTLGQTGCGYCFCLSAVLSVFCSLVSLVLLKAVATQLAEPLSFYSVSKMSLFVAVRIVQFSSSQCNNTIRSFILLINYLIWGNFEGNSDKGNIKQEYKHLKLARDFFCYTC